MSSPEPRRRPAAVSRLVVPPDEPGPGYTQGSSLPSSSQSEAPQPAAQPPPRTPKPLRTIKHVPTPPAHVYRGDRVLMAVFATFMIMLLFAAAGVYQMKHRHQEAVTRQLRGRFEDEMNLQVEWMAVTMSELSQCQSALKRADADYNATRHQLQLCQQQAHVQHKDKGKPHNTGSGGSGTGSSSGGSHLSSSIPWLQFELQAARQEQQATVLKLHKAEAAAKALQDKQQAQLKQAAAQAEAHAKALQEAQSKLKKLEAEVHKHQTEVETLKGLREKLQQVEADLEVAQQLLKEQDKAAADWMKPVKPVGTQTQQTQQQALPTAIAAAAPHGAAAAAAAAASTKPVILVACTAADASPSDDIIRPWCESAVMAGLRRVMVVTNHDACSQAAAEAGVKVLRHSFKVPHIPGKFAEASQHAYQKFAALKHVLSLGHPAVVVEPDLLLLSSPMNLLEQYPTDVVAVSQASQDAGMAYGHVVPAVLDGPEEDSSPDATPHSQFNMHALSTSFLFLRPGPASLAFVDAMLAGLAEGHRPEGELLSQLLLSPWHLPDRAAAALDGSSGSSGGSSGSSGAASSDRSSSSGSSSGATAPALLPHRTPLTIGVLPVSKFTSSAAVMAAAEPVSWLQQQQPLAVQVLPGQQGDARARAAVMEDILVQYWAGQPDNAVQSVTRGSTGQPDSAVQRVIDGSTGQPDSAVQSVSGGNTGEPNSAVQRVTGIGGALTDQAAGRVQKTDASGLPWVLGQGNNAREDQQQQLVLRQELSQEREQDEEKGSKQDTERWQEQQQDPEQGKQQGTGLHEGQGQDQQQDQSHQQHKQRESGQVTRQAQEHEGDQDQQLQHQHQQKQQRESSQGEKQVHRDQEQEEEQEEAEEDKQDGQIEKELQHDLEEGSEQAQQEQQDDSGSMRTSSSSSSSSRQPLPHFQGEEVDRADMEQQLRQHHRQYMQPQSTVAPVHRKHMHPQVQHQQPQQRQQSMTTGSTARDWHESEQGRLPPKDDVLLRRHRRRLLLQPQQLQ